MRKRKTIIDTLDKLQVDWGVGVANTELEHLDYFIIVSYPPLEVEATLRRLDFYDSEVGSRHMERSMTEIDIDDFKENKELFQELIRNKYGVLYAREGKEIRKNPLPMFSRWMLGVPADTE